jgi:hypothetical protein
MQYFLEYWKFFLQLLPELEIFAKFYKILGLLYVYGNVLWMLGLLAELPNFFWEFWRNFTDYCDLEIFKGILRLLLLQYFFPKLVPVL